MYFHNIKHIFWFIVIVKPCTEQGWSVKVRGILKIQDRFRTGTNIWPRPPDRVFLSEIEDMLGPTSPRPRDLEAVIIRLELLIVVNRYIMWYNIRLIVTSHESIITRYSFIVEYHFYDWILRWLRKGSWGSQSKTSKTMKFWSHWTGIDNISVPMTLSSLEISRD